MVKATTKLPKNHNAADGKKAHFDDKFYKVGRIKRNSWANKVLQAYDIIIYERELVHIYTDHEKELLQIGFSAFDFVKIIISNFNEIYEGNNGAKILVVKHEEMSNRAIIELVLDKKQYKIKTATPINTERLSKMKLLLSNFCKVGY